MGSGCGEGRRRNEAGWTTSDRGAGVVRDEQAYARGDGDRRQATMCGECRIISRSLRYVAWPIWPLRSSDSRSSRTRSMAWSLPAKTGWRTKVSTRSMMVDSRGMAIPIVMSHDDKLSDLLSIAFASRIPKQPVESDRDAAASAPVPDALPPAGPAAGPGTRGTVLVPQGPGRWSSGSHPVNCRRRRPVPSPPSRVSRRRVEGRTRRWFRLSWWIDRVIAPRTDGGGSGSSSSRVGRRGAPWANCCLWTTTRT
jgi:hypothetical protein